jgi:predicted nucleic acid-binding protein
VIVSNTTPLSCLLKVGEADLLQRLYVTLAIPAEVAAELDQAGSLHQGWRRQPAWHEGLHSDRGVAGG